MGTRRDFLGKMSLTALSLPILYSPTSLFAACEQPYDGPMLRVAIMGLGSYGTRVAKAMVDCKRAKLVGVISGTPSKILKWQATYDIPQKNCYNYDDFDAIKDNPDIDAVYIITPNALHCEQAIRVAKAGKHVICEKPMAINAEEAERMVNACKTPR